MKKKIKKIKKLSADTSDGVEISENVKAFLLDFMKLCQLHGVYFFGKEVEMLVNGDSEYHSFEALEAHFDPNSISKVLTFTPPVGLPVSDTYILRLDGDISKGF